MLRASSHVAWGQCSLVARSSQKAKEKSIKQKNSSPPLWYTNAHCQRQVEIKKISLFPRLRASCVCRCTGDWAVRGECALKPPRTKNVPYAFFAIPLFGVAAVANNPQDTSLESLRLLLRSSPIFLDGASFLPVRTTSATTASS